MGQRVDSANIGVEAVGEAKIDDPINSTEGNRGLRPISSERIEPLTPAACKDDGQDFHGCPSIKLGCDRSRGWPIPSSRCTTQILLYMEECLTRMITVMEIIKLNSIFEVHRSRFRDLLFNIEARRFYSGSRRPPDTYREEECAIV